MISRKSRWGGKTDREFRIFSEIFGREANADRQEKNTIVTSPIVGIKEDYIYILKEGVVKTSVIMRDGRELTFYLKAIDIVSLIRDEVSNYTDSPFNVRVETEEASFYRIPRVKFWNFVKRA